MKRRTYNKPVPLSARTLTKIEPGSTYALVIDGTHGDVARFSEIREAFHQRTGAELVVVVVQA